MRLSRSYSRRLRLWTLRESLSSWFVRAMAPRPGVMLNKDFFSGLLPMNFISGAVGFVGGVSSLSAISGEDWLFSGPEEKSKDSGGLRGVVNEGAR